MNALSLTLVKKSLRGLFLISFVVPAIVLLANTPAQAQTSTWSGGAGNWAPCPNNGGNALWDTCSANPPQYPDGNYNAVIQGGPVTLGPTNGISIVDLTVDAGDSLIITPGYLFINGTSMVNQGAISVGDGNGLGIQGPSGNTINLTGGGTITMLTANTRIAGSSGVPTTLVNVDNTIQGQGAIGLGEISLVNQKTISASGGTLTIQPNTSGVTNTGLIEAQSGSTLALIGTYTNAGGTIKALDGGTISLDGGLISGGTLASAGSGMFTTPPGGDDPMLNGVTNSALIDIPSGASATLEGAITNNGTIQVPGELFFSGNVTMKGTGAELLQGGTLQRAGGADVLTNQQLIHGGGTIFELPLTNQATIDADNTTTALTIAGGTTTNNSIIEASGGGTLTIQNNSTVNNSGGTIEALTGSTVILSGTVNGGTLTTSGTGKINSENGTLDGTVNVPTNAGVVDVSGFSLFLQGTVNNTGTIAMSGTSCIILNQPTTLTGSGKVTLGTSNCIFGSGMPLTNQSTIEGNGSIGDSNPMGITNDGTILANKTTGTLRIIPDSNGFTNNGKLTVNKGSTLIINTVGGPFNNLVGSMLTGGTYTVTGMLVLAGAITTNAASITLMGPAAEILNTSTNKSALTDLAANTTQGVLSLQTGQALTTATSFSNAGKATVGTGSSFTVGGSYTQTAGTTTVDGTLTASTGLNVQKGTLEGKGTLAAAVTSSGTVIVGDATTKPGLLTVTGTYAQSTGTLDVAIGGTTVGSQYSQMAVSNGVSLGGTLTIKRVNGFTPTIGEVFTILKGSAVTGQFAKVNGLSINSGEHFEVGYTSTAVTLTVMSGA
jgi:fibronectin-binding autotransporter adhesin